VSAQEAERAAARPRRRSGVDLDALAMQEEERTFLLASLADLEREHAAGDIDDDDYRALKDDYTARAATLLRAIDAGKASLPGAEAPRRPLRTVGRVGLVLALGVGSGVAVSQSSGLRLPGEVATGGIRDSSTTLLNEAQGLFQAGELLDAIRTFDEVLKISPGNTEAMTYRGWALFQAGTAAGNVDLLDAAEASIDQAIATDASYAPALVFKSVILARYHGDPGAAFETVNEALNVEPPPPPDVRELAEQFRASLAAELGGSMSPSTTTG
jgi:tetratricopeptide (TPR) repeat protein